MRGVTLEGRFLVERELGAGGMGQVYLARDLNDRCPVALKVLRETLADRPELTARLRREAAAAARVRHPNVVAIRHVGTLPSGGLYLAMEYLDGTSLEQLLVRAGPLPGPRVAQLLRQLAEGLVTLHAAGVVHRDVKPANVMLVGVDTAAPRAVLMDLGLARLADVTRLTATGAILGTPSYMAPEQLAGVVAGPPADVYAFGLVAYTALTGSPPHHALDLGALLAARQSDPTPVPSRTRPDLAPGWDALVASCVRDDPAARVTAEALVAALGELAASRSSCPAPPQAIVAPSPACRRGPPMAPAALVLLVVAALALGVVRWRGAPVAAPAPVVASRSPSVPPPPAPYAPSEEVRALVEQLRGWRADEAMEGVKDMLLPSLVDVFVRVGGERDKAAEEADAVGRRARARALLGERLAADDRLAPYRRAADGAPRLLADPGVPAARRLELLACLRPFLELRCFVDAHGLQVNPALLPRPDLGPFAVRPTPLPGRAVEVPLAWPGGAAPLLGHLPRVQLPATVDRAEATVTFPDLAGVERAELRLHAEPFETWPLFVQVGRGPVSVVMPPERSPRGKKAVTLYVGLVVELLDAGPNRVAVACPPLYGYLLNTPTRLTESSVRLVTGR